MNILSIIYTLFLLFVSMCITTLYGYLFYVRANFIMFLVVTGGLIGFCVCFRKLLTCSTTNAEQSTPKFIVHNPMKIPSTFIVIQNPESTYSIGYLCEQKGTKQNPYRRKRMTKPQMFTTHPIT